MKLLSLLAIALILLPSQEAWAEPWLANKFSKNCAGCHAPGRLNRKPKDRRCTLSCQGCHVNPNGGGLRNHYGKWNSERWLRSFYSKATWSRKSVKPLKHQKYAKDELSKTEKRLYARKGASLEEFPAVVKNPKPYYESSNYVSAKNKYEEMVRIPKDDPYRQERRDYVQAGGDFRFFYIKQTEGAASSKLEEGTFYPMVFDVGVRVRPTRRNLSFIYEGRAFNTDRNDPSSLDKLFAGQAGTRSAYVMVDDLPFNSYMQYGIYRPLFGLHNPNHNAMIYDYNELNQFISTKNIGFGVAPNVPFGIINLIQPTEGFADTDLRSESGFVITGGLRFVTLGAHATFSYWSTNNDDAALPRKRVMYDLNAGLALNNRWILNGEIMNIKRTEGTTNEAMIIAAEAKYRIWREFYLQAGYTVANSAVAINTVAQFPTRIGPGSGNEIAFGTKAFLTSGIEMETLYTSKENKEDGFAAQKEDTLQMQLHAYF